MVSASAATMSLISKGQSFGIGQEFTADLIVNSENADINAAQAVINFPPEILQVVSVDRGKSVFNFWVEDPSISSGKVSFIGGTSESVTGNSLLVFTVKFKTVGAGRADIGVSDGIVTASDGKGTNVLSTVRGATVTVSTSVSSPTPSPETIQVVQPQRIIREAVPSAKLPSKPKVSVNLYPDPSKWYNHSGDVVALWEVPEDVLQVASLIDQNPTAIPTKFDKELFNGKNFGALKEGIWYLHVRFKNSAGGGPASHYRLALDFKPPLPFRIETSEGLRMEGEQDKLTTDNPQPILTLRSNDSLSGIEKYTAQIDGQESVEAPAGGFKLPLQPPGTRTVTIKAIDNAGNAQEKSLILEITPLASPVITFINKDNFAGEGQIVIRGTTIAGYSVNALLKKAAGDAVTAADVAADQQGNWETVIDHPLGSGSYFFEVVAKDSRGALSLPVKSEVFKIKERPLFTIAGFGITQFWFFVGLIVILLAGFGVGTLSHHLWKAQLARRTVVAQRDVVSSFDVIGKDIDKALSNYQDNRVSKTEASEIDFLLKKVKGNLGKMKKYIVENIDEIPK